MLEESHMGLQGCGVVVNEVGLGNMRPEVQISVETDKQYLGDFFPSVLALMNIVNWYLMLLVGGGMASISWN